MTHPRTTRYRIEHLADLPARRCPCGWARRAFTDDPAQTASMHVTEIEADSRPHYHKKLTEFYYILEGSGHMQLDGESIAVGPGDAILIKPYCRHRAVGRIKALIVPVPAFDETDEHFD